MAYIVNGEMIEGGSVDVVESMLSLVYDSDRFESLDAYMDWFAKNAWRFGAHSIVYNGATIDERCESFVNALLENEIIKFSE